MSRTTTKSSAACGAPICSRWCTSSSSPTPPTTPTSCFRPPPSSSRKTCRRHTATTTCRCRTRQLSRWANAARTWKCFAALAHAMGFDDPCFRDSVDEMIDQALDSPNPWLKGIDRERLEREGHVRLNFDGSSSENGHRRFFPSRKADFKRRAAKRNFTTPLSSRRGSTRLPNLFRLRNRGTASGAVVPARTARPQSRQFPEFDVSRTFRRCRDGGNRTCSKSIPADAASAWHPGRRLGPSLQFARRTCVCEPE